MPIQILRCQYGLTAPRSRTDLGLRRSSERSLRSTPLLHRHPTEHRILQRVLLVLRLRARLHWSSRSSIIVKPASAAGLRGIAEESVGWDLLVDAKHSCETNEQNAALAAPSLTVLARTRTPASELEIVERSRPDTTRVSAWQSVGEQS